MLKKDNGVTMITLVVTIVVTLILATVTISYTVGKGSILEQSIDSANISRVASVQELFQYYVSNDYADDKDVFVELINKGYVKQLKDENNKIVFYITHDGIKEIAPNFADTTSDTYIYTIISELSTDKEANITVDDLELLKDADVYLVDREFNVAYLSNNNMYGNLIFSEEDSIAAVDKWWLSEDDVENYDFNVKPVDIELFEYVIKNGNVSILGFNEEYFNGSQNFDGDLAIPDYIQVNADTKYPVTSIDRKAFRRGEKTNISINGKVYIPSTVTSIGEDAFREQNNIKEVYIAAISIGKGAFKDCRNIASLNITPNTTQYIAESAFEGVSNGLSTVTFPEGIISIGNKAFKNCSAIGDLVFPSTLTSIGEEAFKGCTNKTKKIDLSKCTLLKKIEDKAFMECNAITALTFAEGLEEIGEEAFKNCRNCSIQDIYLPDSLKEIDEKAFDGLYNVNGNISINRDTEYEYRSFGWELMSKIDER